MKTTKTPKALISKCTEAKKYWHLMCPNSNYIIFLHNDFENLNVKTDITITNKNFRYRTSYNLKTRKYTIR